LNNSQTQFTGKLINNPTVLLKSENKRAYDITPLKKSSMQNSICGMGNSDEKSEYNEQSINSSFDSGTNKLPLLRHRKNAETLDMISKKLTQSINLEQNTSLPSIYEKNRNNNNNTVLENEQQMIHAKLNNTNNIGSEKSNDSESSSDESEGDRSKMMLAKYRKNSWRKYFTEEEIETAYKNIARGMEETNSNENTEHDPMMSGTDEDSDQTLDEDLSPEKEEQKDENNSVITVHLNTPADSYFKSKQVPLKISRIPPRKDAEIHKIDLNWNIKSNIIPPQKSAIPMNTKTFAKRPIAQPRPYYKSLHNEYNTSFSLDPTRGRSIDHAKPYQTNNQPDTTGVKPKKINLKPRRQVSENIKHRSLQWDNKFQTSANRMIFDKEYGNFSGIDTNEIINEISEELVDERLPKSDKSPTININIGNINIQSYPYMNHENNKLSKAPLMFDNSSVIAAIPRHDETKKFKELFKPTLKYNRDYHLNKRYLPSHRRKKSDLEQILADFNTEELNQSLGSANVFKASHLYANPEKKRFNLADI